MNTCTDQEHVWLQLRVDELEARVAELEAEIRDRHGESAAGTAEDGVGDQEREGARLVVLEMLTTGYSQDQIAEYLRHTFAVEDAEALLAEAGAVAG